MPSLTSSTLSVPTTPSEASYLESQRDEYGEYNPSRVCVSCGCGIWLRAYPRLLIPCPSCLVYDPREDLVLMDILSNGTTKPCILCHVGVGLTRLGGSCASCAWQRVSELRAERARIILEYSAKITTTEREIASLFAALETPDGVSLSLQSSHRCICGEASPSYLDIASHISLHDDWKSHRLELGEDRARRVLAEKIAKNPSYVAKTPTTPRRDPSLELEDDLCV
jgi:hypothetical protein